MMLTFMALFINRISLSGSWGPLRDCQDLRAGSCVLSAQLSSAVLEPQPGIIALIARSTLAVLVLAFSPPFCHAYVQVHFCSICVFLPPFLFLVWGTEPGVLYSPSYTSPFIFHCVLWVCTAFRGSNLATPLSCVFGPAHAQCQRGAQTLLMLTGDCEQHEHWIPEAEKIGEGT